MRVHGLGCLKLCIDQVAVAEPPGRAHHATAARPYYRTCPLITHDTYWCALVESMCDMRTAELDSWEVSDAKQDQPLAKVPVS